MDIKKLIEDVSVRLDRIDEEYEEMRKQLVEMDKILDEIEERIKRSNYTRA